MPKSKTFVINPRGWYEYRLYTGGMTLTEARNNSSLLINDVMKIMGITDIPDEEVNIEANRNGIYMAVRYSFIGTLAESLTDNAKRLGYSIRKGE